MKHLFSGLLFMSLSLFSIGQQSFDDLKILYADGNYEKLVKEAEKYCEADDTKKDPMPHMWLAKGYYKISISGNDDPEFKNAFKDALGAMSKFLKNDKDGSARMDSDNAEFLDLIQSSLMEQIENELTIDNYRKAYSWVLKYKKVSDNYVGEMYLEGACKFRTDDKSSAFSLWRDAEKMISETTSTESWSETDLKILKVGVLESAECLVSVRQVDKAKTLLNKVAPLFEDDKDFKASYDAIVN